MFDYWTNYNHINNNNNNHHHYGTCILICNLFKGHLYVPKRKKMGSPVPMLGTKISEASLVEYPSGCQDISLQDPHKEMGQV